MALTSENERPIDLADQTDFPTISLLLNNMKSEDGDENEDEDEDENEEENQKNEDANEDTKIVDYESGAHVNDDHIKPDNNKYKQETETYGKKKKSRFSIV